MMEKNDYPETELRKALEDYKLDESAMTVAPTLETWICSIGLEREAIPFLKVASVLQGLGAKMHLRRYLENHTAVEVHYAPCMSLSELERVKKEKEGLQRLGKLAYELPPGGVSGSLNVSYRIAGWRRDGIVFQKILEELGSSSGPEGSEGCRNVDALRFRLGMEFFGKDEYFLVPVPAGDEIIDMFDSSFLTFKSLEGEALCERIRGLEVEIAEKERRVSLIIEKAADADELDFCQKAEINKLSQETIKLRKKTEALKEGRKK